MTAKGPEYVKMQEPIYSYEVATRGELETILSLLPTK